MESLAEIVTGAVEFDGAAAGGLSLPAMPVPSRTAETATADTAPPPIAASQWPPRRGEGSDPPGGALGGGEAGGSDPSRGALGAGGS